MQFSTPLRYPGGKGRLSQFVADVIEQNKLEGGDYLEPYAGGAGIAISLLFLEYVSRIHINDVNRSVYAFWHSVLNRPEEFCSRISRTRVSMAEWHRQKNVQDDPNADLFDLGFSTFFLNRTNRSGIIRGGVIGGKGQTGDWKLDARYNKKNLILRIQKIAELEHKIKIYNKDAKVIINSVLPTLPRKTLVYLDPPYYVKGKGLYEDHYEHKDHVDIAKLVKQLSHRWIVSYDNVWQIRKFYAGFRQRTFGLHYSAHNRYSGSEVMIFCDALTIPGKIEPSRAEAA